MRTLLLILISLPLFAAETIDNSIVKIFATLKRYDYEFPWQAPQTYQATGSGFILENNQIITNAHAIANASFIEVSSSGSQERFEASVKVIGHDCDLALLTLEDPKFFRGKKPLGLSDQPIRKEEEVQVYGFPMGGKSASVTKGIVSRVEMAPYAHSGCFLLTTQIDAPINFGNSGGPVLANGKVVGIVHQGSVVGQNIGYMIPIPVIRHFLEGAGSEVYRGFPEASFEFQTLRNPAMRKYYGLNEDEGGIFITEVPESHFLHSFLKKGDILLQLDHTPIDRYGRIYFEELDLCLPFEYALQMKHYGDPLKIAFLREGELYEHETVIDDTQLRGELVSQEFDKPPTYYILGGLVFQPLVLNLINGEVDLSNLQEVFDLCSYFLKGKVTDEVDEVVVLSQVLKDHANQGYQGLRKKVVESVNGKKIRNIRDLIATFENCDAPYYHITTKDRIEIILDREVIQERHQKILSRYFIPSDRSQDL